MPALSPSAAENDNPCGRSIGAGWWALRAPGRFGSWIAERHPQAGHGSVRVTMKLLDILGDLLRRGRLTILCYHAVQDLSENPLLRDYGVPPGELAAQLDQLARRGFSFVGPDRLIEYLAHGVPLPRRAVMVTFDDCYAELLDTARDILSPRGIQAIAFAVTRRIGRANAWDMERGAGELRLLDADGLHNIRAEGIEIGGHSRHHVDLTTVEGLDLQAETRGAADDLQALGFPRPRFFAYPYGSNDVRTHHALDEAGYLAGFSLRKGFVRREGGRFDVPRVEILRRDAGWRFALKTAIPRAAALFGLRARALGAMRRAFLGTAAKTP
ncbi:polysaccharide deacetylase family protein [Tsuneonella sp. HG222]